MKKITTIIAAITMLFAASCSKTEMQSPVGAMNNTMGTPKSIHGIGSAIPAFYDSVMHTIIFEQFSATAAANLIAHNGSINFIYQSDNGLPNNQPFISVIDAIPGDGMNPVWREVQIVFNANFIPHQLYSDNEVLAAAASGEITLNMSDEVYWCPVVHH